MTASLWPVLNVWADHWWSYMTTSMVDATIGLALILCIYAVVRRRVPPRWCYLLFLLVPMKLLTPVSLPLLPSSTSVAGTDAVTVVEHSGNLDGDRTSTLLPAPSLGTQDDRASDKARVRKAPTAAASTVAASTGPRPTIAALLMLCWALIVLWMGATFTWNQLRLRRLLSDAQPATASTVGIRMDAACSKLNAGRKYPILISNRISVPAVVGLLRSRIVLPTALLSSLDSKQLHCVLAHELAHVRWHDVPVALLERLVRIVHFANPAVWFAAHLAHLHREDACDDASIAAAGVDRVTCGETLLRVLEFAHGRQHDLSGAVAMFERTSSASRRMRRIMTPPASPRMSAVWSIPLLLVVTIVLLPNLRAAPHAAATAGDGPVENASKRQTDHNPAPAVLREAAPEQIEIAGHGTPVRQAHNIAPLLARGARPDGLIELITSTVVPDRWDSVGGIGSITFDAETGKLQIVHFPSVHKAIARMLTVFQQVAAEETRGNSSAGRRVLRCIELFAEPQTEQLVCAYVVPSLIFSASSPIDPRQADYDTVIALTTIAVKPDSWDEVGGRGSIAPWPPSDLLVIAQSSSAHDAILDLYAILDRFPSASSRKIPPSIKPIEISRQRVVMRRSGQDANTEVDLVARLYPVHDLLPGNTRPDFANSPRAVGIDQLCHWLVTRIAPGTDDPIDTMVGVHNKGLLYIVASAPVHQRIDDALKDVRQRLQTAANAAARARVRKELAPSLFRVVRSGYPATGPSAWRIYLHGDCNADQQLANLAVNNLAADGKQVYEVQLIATDVTDRGLAAIASLSTVSNLVIGSRHVTDKGVAMLITRLSFLQTLALHGEQITDAVADAIASRRGLYHLDLSRTSISDKGLEKIVAGRQWLQVDVSHTKVTEAAAKLLRARYPQVSIRINP